MRRLQEFPEEQREGLREVLAELAADAGARAEIAWDRKKAPMAAYWKAVAVYAKHVRRALANAD